MTPHVLSQTSQREVKTRSIPVEPGLVEAFLMAGKTLFWLQSVATVLPFAPPGLLLIATFLQLRKSPVRRMLETLREERKRLMRTAGQIAESKAMPGDDFVARLHSAMDRARRNGRNLIVSIGQMEEGLEKIETDHQSVRELFSGLFMRTKLAILFAAGLTAIAQLIGFTATPTIHQIAITATGSSCLLMALILLPASALLQAHKSLDIPQNATGLNWIQWIETGRWIRAAGSETENRRDGIRDPALDETMINDGIVACSKAARSAMKRAETMVSVYEVLALAPATAILVSGNLF